MFCIHCGQKMPDYGQFCPRCGRPAIKPDQANESAEMSATHEANSQNHSNSNTNVNQSNTYNQADLYNRAGSYNQAQNQQGPYGQRNPYGNFNPYHQGPESYQQQVNSQQVHTQQGYTQQVHTQQGYTQQGYHNQGYSNQEYSNQGYPHQTYSQQQQPVFEWQMGPWVGSKDIWSVFKDCMTVQFKDFSGRATRAEYLRFTLVMYSIFFLVELIVYGFDITALQNISFYVMLFAFMVPTYAVTVRRLHDSGLSGFWVLMEVPNSLVEILIGPNEPGRMVEPFTMIASFLSLILFFVCLRRSQIFTNEYGPLPDFTKYVKP